MKYYRYFTSEREHGPTQPHLVAVDGSDAYDLTAASEALRSFDDLAKGAAISMRSIDDVAAGYLEDATPIDSDDLGERAAVPVVAEGVWAAGVTYEISEEARESESTLPEVYQQVYQDERPELFFKATPSRTVGPNEAVGIRGDSTWDVPEPELGIVLYDDEVVGYTVGNDMSSRDIEGKNPLYLPQAKVYDRCCALGPCISSPGTVADPHDLRLAMTIERDGEVCYDEETSTSKLVRTVDELVSYHTRHDATPRMGVLLTGTSLVPEDEFTLQEGDVVSIEIESIGTLRNPVTTV
ncbi:fumarylacetoacetate hydrolase family protein [Natrinema gelatinilyticum]|uniref:fumarylacetoacetate hydrolase family protein n=1 Tax=Natrinema gelatinilyticum TaxID=2961571 RepID=UPI0020C30ABA|nr:fumarylacetoacetate hydrolase family protein [Natrinema gelatinilyticum]